MPVEELLVLLNLNAKLIFIAKVLLKLLFSNLLHPFEVESTSHGPFQRQCFKITSIQQWTYFLLVRKIRPFSHEKVVIMQSDAYRRFYVPIYAKWLPLIESFLWVAARKTEAKLRKIEKHEKKARAMKVTLVKMRYQISILWSILILNRKQTSEILTLVAAMRKKALNIK